MNHAEEKVVRQLVKMDWVFMDLVDQAAEGLIPLQQVWPTYFLRVLGSMSLFRVLKAVALTALRRGGPGED